MTRTAMPNRPHSLAWFTLGIVALAAASCATRPTESLSPRSRFVAIEHLTGFAPLPSPTDQPAQLLSPVVRPGILWQELVVSWNVPAEAGVGLKVEARAFHKSEASDFFTLGLWSADPNAYPRQSVPGQSNAWGRVLTDTLVLREPADAVQLRLTLTGPTTAPHRAVPYLGLSFLNLDAVALDRASHREAWGKTLPVPPQSQLAFEGGAVWCSPTATAMILRYWSERLDRPDWRFEVPEVAARVYDPNWPGTGNWPFNTAFAGSLPGMRAWVTRFDDLTDVETWTAAGLPVALSVSYNRLKGLPIGGSGHLIVCVGFDRNGDVIVNDPGTRTEMRRTFAREVVRRAWAESRNTVYLIYPERLRLPRAWRGTTQWR